MAQSIGTNNKIECYEHFLSFNPDSNTAAYYPVGSNGVMSCGIGGTTQAQTTDEPGGILSLTTDTTDNDNVVLWIGPFKPADGGVWMETRLKVDAINDLAVFVGWTETLATDTPVMPVEFATESFAFLGSGGVVGLQFDADGTTDDWRAVAGDAGTPLIDCDSLATAALQPPVADEFDVIRVEIDVGGYGKVWLADNDGGLRLVKNFDTAAAVTPTDVGFMAVMVEARANAAAAMEVDYFNAGGNIDWTR